MSVHIQILTLVCIYIDTLAMSQWLDAELRCHQKEDKVITGACTCDVHAVSAYMYLFRGALADYQAGCRQQRYPASSNEISTMTSCNISV